MQGVSAQPLVRVKQLCRGDERIVRRIGAARGPGAVALLLGVPIKMASLLVERPRRWTNSELDIITDMYLRCSVHAIATAIDRSPEEVMAALEFKGLIR